MASKGTQPKKPELDIGKAVLVIVSLCLLVIGMVWSLDYPFPGGKLDFWGFVGLWSRELLIVGGAVVVLLYVAVVKLVKSLSKHKKDGL